MSRGIYLGESDYSAENIAGTQAELADFSHSRHPGVGEMHIVVDEIAAHLGKDSEAVIHALSSPRSTAR